MKITYSNLAIGLFAMCISFTSCNRGPAKLDIPEPTATGTSAEHDIQSVNPSPPPSVPATQSAGASCLEAAYDIAMATDFFQDLLEKDPELGLMEDTQTEGDVYDFRIFEDHEEHTVTVARMRVDIAQRKVYEYDVVNDRHIDLHAQAKLFDDYPCE